MRATTAPALSPNHDRTVYLVLDDFGPLGCAYRETDPAEADRKTVVADLLSGQYRHPLRVVAFNTAEGWARDVHCLECATIDAAGLGRWVLVLVLGPFGMAHSLVMAGENASCGTRRSRIRAGAAFF